jgi:hypothetical protein
VRGHVAPCFQMKLNARSSDSSTVRVGQREMCERRHLLYYAETREPKMMRGRNESRIAGNGFLRNRMPQNQAARDGLEQSGAAAVNVDSDPRSSLSKPLKIATCASQVRRPQQRFLDLMCSGTPTDKYRSSDIHSREGEKRTTLGTNNGIVDCCAISHQIVHQKPQPGLRLLLSSSQHSHIVFR